MAAAEDDQVLFDLVEELRDRYGELPEAGRVLVGVMGLRIVLKRLSVELLEFV